MAYLETFVSRVCGLLTRSGLTAYPDYARRLKAIPPDCEFLTVGAEKLTLDAPFSEGDSTVIPADLLLRVRLHCRTQESADGLSILFETVLLPELLDGGIAVGKAELTGTVYSKTLDRLVREVQIHVPALIIRAPVPTQS